MVGGFLAELCVFAIVFPVRYLFGQRAFLASIVIASALMPFLFALWVGRGVQSAFLIHGRLIYVGLAWGQPEPLLYKVAHGFKVVGGMAGGMVVSRRKLGAALTAQSQ